MNAREASLSSLRYQVKVFDKGGICIKTDRYMLLSMAIDGLAQLCSEFNNNLKDGWRIELVAIQNVELVVMTDRTLNMNGTKVVSSS